MFVPRLGPGLADPAGLLVLGIIQGALFVAAVVGLAAPVFGDGVRTAAPAVVAAVVGAVAGTIGDAAAAAHLPFELIVVAAVVGQIGVGGWFLVVGLRLARSGTHRSLGWLGVGGSLAFLAAAALLAFQVLTDTFLEEAALVAALPVILAVVFLGRLGWLAATGALASSRTAR